LPTNALSFPYFPRVKRLRLLTAVASRELW
jgi:hypothetical protein